MTATVGSQEYPGPERRSNNRFWMDLEMHYDTGESGEVGASGWGRVLNISSGGVLVDSDCTLTPGSKVRLKVAWPVPLNGVVPLTLDINGEVVRHNQRQFAVKIHAAQFRTRSFHRFAAQAQAV
jgi:hypothetical protein